MERIIEIEDGEILIDGINIQSVKLSTLRSNISIIPQEPFLFDGTIRENIDPLKKYEDKDIWNILQKVKLNEKIKNLPKQLEYFLYIFLFIVK